jgi:hypothetical protein
MNYQKGKIYKIVSNVTDDVYYGSTTQILSKRLGEHRSKYKLYLKQLYGYTTSFKLIETENYEIVLVENYPCCSKDELNSRERFYIENNKCVNKVVPSRTREEREKTIRDEKLQKKDRNENRNKTLEKKIYDEQYYQNNKEHILKRMKEEITCEICGSKIKKCSLTKHKLTNKCKNNILIIY